MITLAIEIAICFLAALYLLDKLGVKVFVDASSVRKTLKNIVNSKE